MQNTTTLQICLYCTYCKILINVFSPVLNQFSNYMLSNTEYLGFISCCRIFQYTLATKKVTFQYHKHCKTLKSKYQKNFKRYHGKVLRFKKSKRKFFWTFLMTLRYFNLVSSFKI